MRRVFTVIAALSMVAAACGDDGSADFLEAVAAGNRQMEVDTFAALPRGETPTRERLVGVIDARAAAVHRLEALSPPAALRTEHEALVITLGVLVDESRRFMSTTEGLDDAGFARALDASTHLDLLAEAVGRACRAMQDRASEAGHAVDLRC
jgi:hypothetical protein